MDEREEKHTFPGFRRLEGKEDQDTGSGDCFLSLLLLDEQFKLLFSCLFAERFVATIFEVVPDSFVSDTATFSVGAGVGIGASGRLREGFCNATTKFCQ